MPVGHPARVLMMGAAVLLVGTIGYWFLEPRGYGGRPMRPLDAFCECLSTCTLASLHARRQQVQRHRSWASK